MSQAPEPANLLNTGGDWNAPPSGRPKFSGNAYLGAPIPSNPTTDGEFAFISNPDQINADANHDEADGPMDAVQDASYLYGTLSQASAPLSFSASESAPTQAGFRATNVLPHNLHNEHTIAPLRTRFDAPLHFTPTLSVDDTPPSTTSPSMTFWGDSVDGESTPRRRNDSLKPTSEEDSPKRSGGPGRRRRSENVQPGSARAVYLEKNRQAASKCRSKQKQQQEELVETAREVERKNKVLKAEVEFLKGDMRDLMEMVGKHASCPDNRLQTYVQREADRLAAGYAGGVQNPVAPVLSPGSSASTHSQQ